MFESFIDFSEIKRRPWLMLVWSLLISTVAILISAQISYRISAGNIVFNLSGLFAVLFTIIPAAYLFTELIKKEESLEEKEIKAYHKKSFWDKHELYVKWAGLFFIGITLSFSVWSFLLPQDFFQVQNHKIEQIQGRFLTGEYVHGDFGSFVKIVYNNLQVMLFAFIFSLAFGAGAVFIISWNASILGVAIARVAGHPLNIPVASLRYLPHGIPEIAAYLVAGLAGGILSAAVIRNEDNRIMRIIALDCARLMVLAIALVLVAGAIEVYL